MLRVIGVVVVMIGCISYAAEYREPSSEEIRTQQGRVERSLDLANEMQGGEAVAEALRTGRQAIAQELGAGPSVMIDVPADVAGMAGIVDTALTAAQDVEQTEAEPRRYPLVLISLSMPESQIRSLIKEAGKVGAGVVIRGFHNDDLQETIQKVHSIVGEEDEGLAGVAIDPTAFRRFGVTRVPAFVLPLDDITPCNNDGCPVVPAVKAAGSMTLHYFLELVGRSGATDARKEAEVWLSHYR